MDIEKYLLIFIKDPYCPYKNFKLGYSYEIQKQYAAALSFYLRCAEFDTDRFQICEALIRGSSCICAMKRRDAKEIYMIKHAISVYPFSIEANYVASLYHSFRQNWLDSYTYACTCKEIYHHSKSHKLFKHNVGYYGYSSILFQLAFTGHHIGKINEARSIYKELIENYSNSPYHNICIQNLKAFPEEEGLKHPIYEIKKNKLNLSSETLLTEKRLLLNSKPHVIVIDDFYKNPNKIREYALQLTYQDPENHGAVGYRSEKGRKILNGTKELFEKLLDKSIPHGNSHGEWNYSTNGCFQWCNAKVPIVYHADSQEYAGIVYLTPDAPPNCGTSFFRHKKYKIRDFTIFNKSDWYNSILNYKEPNLDKTQWEIVDSIGNVYNRLVIFNARYIHAVTEYFGEDINNSRLFQLFFFNVC